MELECYSDLANCSILFNIYFVDPPREPRDINIVEFDRAFRDGFNSAEARDRGIIVPFLEGDRQRFAYNMTMVGGSRSEIMMAQDDPTQRAVVIHSFVGEWGKWSGDGMVLPHRVSPCRSHHHRGGLCSEGDVVPAVCRES